jgi:hypothetical protein
MADPSLDAALADRLARAARASQELCEVLWETLQDELRAPRPARVQELSERLAAIAAIVSALAREPSATPGSVHVSAPPAPAPAPPPLRDPSPFAAGDPVLGGALDPYGATAPGMGGTHDPYTVPVRPVAPSPARSATLVDEREGAPIEIRDTR